MNRATNAPLCAVDTYNWTTPPPPALITPSTPPLWHINHQEGEGGSCFSIPYPAALIYTSCGPHSDRYSPKMWRTRPVSGTLGPSEPSRCTPTLGGLFGHNVTPDETYPSEKTLKVLETPIRDAPLEIAPTIIVVSIPNRK
ncbi:hypothetical protein J6590_020842 [Homalodisca vitripennis]|nr:hypothetical protein J6590_020842 [Homalodisca vitripennis]